MTTLKRSLSDHLDWHQLAPGRQEERRGTQTPRVPLALSDPRQQRWSWCPGLQWTASSPAPGRTSSMSTWLSSSAFRPGCNSSWGRSSWRSLQQQPCWRTSSCPSWASSGWMQRSWSGCWRSACSITQWHSCNTSSMSPCSTAAGRPIVCWAWRTAPLLRGGRAAPWRAPCPAASRRGSLAPGPAPSDSLAAAHEEEHPSTSNAALRGGPSSPPNASVPTHGEKEGPHEGPGEAVAGPSSPSRGRDCCPAGPQQAPKRRASSS